jgi:hypothetical protein
VIVKDFSGTEVVLSESADVPGFEIAFERDIEILSVATFFLIALHLLSILPKSEKKFDNILKINK